MQDECHKGGLFAATGVVAIITIGAHFTTLRGLPTFDYLWLAGYGFAWMLASAAAVNFNWKRWLW